MDRTYGAERIHSAERIQDDERIVTSERIRNDLSVAYCDNVDSVWGYDTSVINSPSVFLQKLLASLLQGQVRP